MVRLPCCLAVVLLSAVCFAETRNITAEQRHELIRRAHIWNRTDVASMNLRTGPRGTGAFAPGATVTCKYHEEKFTGATPKFGCTIEDDEHVKVRYGRDNAEIFTGVGATRLLWALGFGADVLYPVHVVCRKCPPEIAVKGAQTPSGDTRFEYAAIERKMPGVELEAPSAGPGWSWSELDLVDPKAGGAPIEQRDALKLLGVMLQHSDSKPEQQKLLCVSDVDKHDVAKCPEPFMMIHDVGQTFGRSNLRNNPEISGGNLAEWVKTPVWKDAEHCVGNLAPSQRISEGGRTFLANLLSQLTDRQLRDLFDVARFGDKPGPVGTSGGGVGDWVDAFKKKRAEIVSARCIG
jgi:hypothetical protein